MIAAIENIIYLPEPDGQNYFPAHARRQFENRKPHRAVRHIFNNLRTRPDVSVEAAAIALIAGNKIPLKGGKEARNTNLHPANLFCRFTTKKYGSRNF